MLEPVLTGEAALAARLGLAAPLVLTTALLGVGLVVAPAAGAAAATWASRRLSGGVASARAIVCRFAVALVPLGLGMWSAHFLFHFFAGLGTLTPVLQRAAGDLGSPLLGRPAWGHVMGPRADWLTGLELLLLDLGLLVSVAVGWRGARALAGAAGARRALALAAPWATLALALWAAGVWIVFQPMQMRGMVH